MVCRMSRTASGWWARSRVSAAVALRLRWLPCLMIAALALAGCTRGKKAADKTGDAPKTEATPKAVDAKAGVDKDWLAGDLPASVTQGTPKQGGEVVVQIWSEPPSLNTLVDSDWLASRMTDHLVYQALVVTDPYDAPNYGLKPELAERWEVSEDQLVFTFHLRKGVRWHDGKPFTARDVIATYDKVLDPTTKAAHVRSYLERLKEYKALDDYTVRFTWSEPYFMTLDTFEMLPIMPAHVIGAMTGPQFNEASSNPLNRHPVGTGPFRFAKWESNQKLVLARNDAYWGKKAHLDRVVFRVVKDATVRRQMAERLEVDVWSRVLDEHWTKASENPVFRDKFHRSMVYDASYAWIGWNQEAKPFLADKRVRRALTMLIDRERIAKTLFYGLRKPVSCHFYWASKECEGLDPLAYDRKAAERLLDEAGWKDSDGDGIRDKGGVPFKFTFMSPASSQDTLKLGTKMKEDYYRLGIDMEIQRVEWTAFVKRLREHEFDACSLMWGGGPRADPVQIWHSKSRDGGSNYVGFSVPEADELIEQAAVEFDPAKRTELYRRFGRILIDEQPYTFLFVRPSMALLNKRIKGARESLMWWQFQDWWVEGAR